ncbi:MAG: UDP-glucose 4-epimerase GalE [Thermoguttaceae bacterium]|nr:UDP-glucose 4-epimerase GalE [Thermoguttaceae bacterium]
MQVLVTGGAGYIGSVTVEKLIEAGYDVVVFDNLYQGHRAAVHPKATFVLGDLAKKDEIKSALETYKPAAVLHFAAYSLVGESVENPFKYMGDNVSNAANLLSAMLETGVNKFILSSTANLFDDPESMPITEKERIVPGSPYGESKAMIERYLYWLDRIKGFRYVALRYFNAAGASLERGEDHHPECHLIPLVLQVAQGKRADIKIFGDDYDTPDGTCIRDYIHIADLAQAHILALEKLLKGGASCKYNLGNGQGYSVKQVIETAREVTGHPIPTEVTPRRPGDPDVLIAGSETIRKELGWVPQYPDLRSIIQSAWNWHVKHPNGYED